MMRILIFLLVFLTPSIAWAKSESESRAAASVVVYGDDDGTIRIIQTAADGSIVITT